MKNTNFLTIPELMEATGLSRFKIEKLMSYGLLKVHYLTPNSRALIPVSEAYRIVNELKSVGRTPE